MWRPIITTIILYGSVLLLVLLTTRIQPVRCDDDDPTNLLRGGNTTLDDVSIHVYIYIYIFVMHVSWSKNTER